jgi:hypothetical protein
MMQGWKAAGVATLVVFKITSFFSAPRDPNIYGLLEEGAPSPPMKAAMSLRHLSFMYLISFLSANIRLNLGSLWHKSTRCYRS